MVSIYELKLGAEKLEILKALSAEIEKTIASIGKIDNSRLNTIYNDILEKANQVLQDKNFVQELKDKVDVAHKDISEKAASINQKFEQQQTLLESLRKLKAEIEVVLKSGIINDGAQSAIQTYSSNLIERKLETKAGAGYSYSKIEMDKKFTSMGTTIAEKLGKSETAADSAKLGGSPADDFMRKSVYKPNNESSANSLVLRDSNGDFAGRYITAGHFRLQAPNQNNIFSGDRELLFREGSAENDNYVRAVSVPYAASVMGVLGINQTWQSVTHLRQAGVTYTNTTGRPIMVSITSHCTTGGSSNLIIDGVGLCITGGGDNMQSSATGIVPNGSTYKYKSFTTGNDFLDNWHELR